MQVFLHCIIDNVGDSQPPSLLLHINFIQVELMELTLKILKLSP